MRYSQYYGVLLALAMVILGCSVQVPEFNITGEKTTLENQVLGVYQQIESDSWVIASTRSIGGGQTGVISAQRKQVLDAVQNRKFNKDEIDEFKRDKVVGENNKGYLEVVPTEKYTGDADYKRLVDQVIAEENQDREVVYERIIAINQSAAEANEEERNQIFFKLNYDNSPSGTLMQKSDGSWTEKK
ncbi:MAG TPA: DUF1318 domain-containing protein [bacterium]|nr:DUF1318 domain-containing protein [bacterium]HPN42687.1 DUF1318 domain-containing protein [bacterium]